MLSLHPIECRDVGIEAQRRCCLLGQRHEEVGVRGADRGLLAARLKALQREGSNGLQHPQPGLSVGHLASPQQAVVHQRPQVGKRARSHRGSHAGDRLGGRWRAPTRKDRESYEHTLFAWG